MEIGYRTLKLLHIFGAILFVGNIAVTAVWKVFADRTRQPAIVAYAQRMVTLTDFVFTGIGAGLVLGTGLLMARVFGEFWKLPWILWGLVLFSISGLIWALALIPIQVRQARLAQEFLENGRIPDSYWRLGRLWMILGIVATLLPIFNLYLMVLRPE